MGKLLSWILLLWAVANFGPYLLVYLVTGSHITRRCRRFGAALWKWGLWF